MRSAAESDSAQKGPDPLEELRARIRRDEIAALDAALASGTDGDGVREPEVGDPAGASALEHAEAALDELFAAGVRPDDARDAVVWIDRLEHLGRRIDAAKSALVGEITRSRFHLTDGHGSPRIMVRHVAKLSEAESLNRTRAAEACADLPKVEAAWQAGTLPTSAANTLGRVHANQRVAPALEARQDEFIADATTMSSKSFASKAHRWERLIDEDGPEPANERNHNNRDTRLRPNPGDLSWDLTGFFASAQGAQMREIFDRFVDAEFEADCAAAKAAAIAAGGTGEITKADLDRTDAQRRADALFRIFQNAATAPDGAIPPGFVHNIHWSATAYEAMLHAIDENRPPVFDPDTFMCRTDDGHDLDPTETAATSLFSTFRRIVVDAAGVVIDLGRARRFTGSARTAATATHTHCIWPGCHAPASRCDIDHLTEHSRNGPTNPANLAHCQYTPSTSDPSISDSHRRPSLISSSELAAPEVCALRPSGGEGKPRGPRAGVARTGVAQPSGALRIPLEHYTHR